MFDKPAKDHPDHKHIFTKATLELLSDNVKETAQRDPDNFGMYVYNDFFNYAVLDLIEELVSHNTILLYHNESAERTDLLPV